jgi:hypothetical protein
MQRKSSRTLLASQDSAVADRGDRRPTRPRQGVRTSTRAANESGQSSLDSARVYKTPESLTLMLLAAPQPRNDSSEARAGRLRPRGCSPNHRWQETPAELRSEVSEPGALPLGLSVTAGADATRRRRLFCLTRPATAAARSLTVATSSTHPAVRVIEGSLSHLELVAPRPRQCAPEGCDRPEYSTARRPFCSGGREPPSMRRSSRLSSASE